MSRPSADSGDAFTRVGAALQRVWPQVGDASSGVTRAEMGMMLDECGSDYRPLVELLLDLGRTVRPVLADCGPQSAAAWPNLRAPLVHKLVSTRYLQPDVARWAVDVWACALGVVTVVEPPKVMAGVASEGDDSSAHGTDDDPRSAAQSAARAASGSGVGRTTGGARAASPRPVTVTPQQVPAQLRSVPSWAGGPVSFRVGQKPKQPSLAALAQSGRVVVRSTSAPAGPRFQPVERRAAMILGTLLVVITGGLMNAFNGRPAPAAPAESDSTGEGARTSTPAEPVAPTVATAMAAPDSALQLPLPLPLSLPASEAAPPPPATGVPHTGGRPVRVAHGARIRDTGVAGRYLVTQRVRDVSGTESCDAVARALGAGRETEEVVSHTPGAGQFTLVTRGVLGTLDSDGQFISEPRSGTTNNVNWQFRMRGRFGPEGFTGESVTHTDAILRWGRLQNCVVTAELTGRRLPD